MGKIFIKKILIENYKCFTSNEVEFNLPDGQTEGSGLNIFIGENGTGKTSLLESINYLTQSSYATENRLKINDFSDYQKEIVIKAETDDFNYKTPYKGNYFECNGFEFSVKSRTQKSPGRLLSSPFQIGNFVVNIHDRYRNSKDEFTKDIINFYRTFDNTNIIDDEINIFYFDKNRTRQITTGNYKTTFERICLDMNWRFIKNLDESNIEKISQNVADEYFNNVLEIAQKGAGEKIAQGVKDFFENEEFENIRIDVLDILHPFTNAFFALRKDKDLTQINIKDLGSGIEIILTLLLLKNIANESKGSLIYLIDEPELHLHPKAQDKLIDLLIKESKDKQIFISTHSPYIYMNCYSKDIGLHIFSKKDSGEISIENAKEKKWGAFPWSPSWSEINYHAFDLPTIEFHNELYGFLQERETRYNESDFEDYLEQNKVTKSKKWIRVQKGVVQTPYDITLCSYIRNYIHHPENTNNTKFTEQELRDSINILINLL